ncbi:Saccharopine dehydrogenase / Homospermidine synthase [Penicillium coprophilum]|uniref:Saccharopine dehydrogenase / Homospermidine synthase n=1 Tax=Penicillium coprophilum TaxID=36646 RepID=UPI002395F3FF|nr:Saccharopine dehydrogenase / Homospermidine synthase [Penicillium coprophilum]KAJ5173636.1 Saccharopine dehydrogenase / Homospermidine synthase [Penicillium coprophilum]
MYDIILFGATGFTGKLCAHFIAQNYPLTTKWCIAGRSLGRLEALAEELKQLFPDRMSPDIEVTELQPSSLKPLVEQTRVVINGIGPFHRFSTPIVAACATLGTHYVDFTTEVPWIREVIENYAEIARQSGSLLLPGLSTSTPSDIIAWLIVNKMQEVYSTNTAEIVSSGKLDIKAMSTGSLNTVLNTFETYGSGWYLYGDSSILSAPFRKETKAPWIARAFGYRYTQELGSLATSFTGSGSQAVIYRSASQSPDLYGPDFHFEEYLPANGVLSAIFVHIFTKVLLVLLSISFVRGLVRMLGTRMDSAPDLSLLRHTERAEYRAVGNGNGGTAPRIMASFVREGALYELTALVTCIGAKVLLDQRIGADRAGNSTRGHGGVVTPSFLGMEYVDRLKDSGIKIEVELL